MEYRKDFERKLPGRIAFAKTKVKKGDILCYRSEIVRVLRIQTEKLIVKGPYTTQGIDWEDVVQYNREFLTFDGAPA